MKSRRSFIASGSLLIGSLATSSQGFSQNVLSASQNTPFPHLKSFKILSESSKLLRGSLSLTEFQEMINSGASLTDSPMMASGNSLQFTEHGKDYQITLYC